MIAVLDTGPLVFYFSPALIEEILQASRGVKK